LPSGPSQGECAFSHLRSIFVFKYATYGSKHGISRASPPRLGKQPHGPCADCNRDSYHIRPSVRCYKDHPATLARRFDCDPVSDVIDFDPHGSILGYYRIQIAASAACRCRHDQVSVYLLHHRRFPCADVYRVVGGINSIQQVGRCIAHGTRANRIDVEADCERQQDAANAMTPKLGYSGGNHRGGWQRRLVGRPSTRRQGGRRARPIRSSDGLQVIDSQKSLTVVLPKPNEVYTNDLLLGIGTNRISPLEYEMEISISLVPITSSAMYLFPSLLNLGVSTSGSMRAFLAALLRRSSVVKYG